ncbi:hypothetical protein MAR_010974 [Mya arenaria]|uniref:Uncharacterized protein n=1 Tax=Mya arenaria TaxID=6604 RepID=A0ABY7FSR5_MYAAR|nr:hypothetical protein MAR_010974 [Mya arenaria]
MTRLFEYRFRFTILICAIPSYISARIVSVDDWTQCPPPSSRFRVLTGLTVEQCAAECEERPACVTLGYLRHPHDGNPCGCPTWSVCDRKSNKCTIKECKPPRNVNNGTILGNRYDVGAKLRVKCDVGYYEEKDMTSPTCTESGNWSHVPSCVSKSIELMFDNQEKTHVDHNNTCVDKGSHMVKINNQTKLDVIKRLMENCNGNNFEWWVDGQKTNGNWIFHDNTPMHFEIKPNGGGKCVVLNKKDWELKGKNNCNQNKGVICERSV